MSEREDHFDLGSGWPLRQDEPGDNRGVGRSPWFGVVLFTALGLLLIVVAIGVRVTMGPPVFAPAESPRPQPFAAPIVKSMPAEELMKIAIAEVKKREGWTGKAVGPYPGEGSERTVGIERDPDNPRGPAVAVILDGITGTIVDYRKNDPKAAEATQAWNELVRTMRRRDEKGVRQLTTPSGFASLDKAVDGGHRIEVFERLGMGWQGWETRWRHSDAPDRVECRLGPEEKEHTLVFKKTAEGWKLDQWTPAE